MSRMSVIITTKNNAETIEECIRRVINAPPEDKEIMVVYGRSRDGTEAIIKKLNGKVKLILDDISTGSAINTGVLDSGGEIIFYVEGHSYVSDEIFIKTLKAFEENPEVGYILFRRYIPPDFKGNSTQRLVNFRRASMEGSVMGQFRAFRRQTFFDVGGFWILPRCLDDLEFATRLHNTRWKIKVLTCKSWDIPRKDLIDVFKHEFDTGVAAVQWYRIYCRHPYAIKAFSEKGEFLKNCARRVFYNMAIRRTFAPIHALKIVLKTGYFAYFPFYVLSNFSFLLGIFEGQFLKKGSSKWLEL